MRNSFYFTQAFQISSISMDARSSRKKKLRRFVWRFNIPNCKWPTKTRSINYWDKLLGHFSALPQQMTIAPTDQRYLLSIQLRGQYFTVAWREQRVDLENWTMTSPLKRICQLGAIFYVDSQGFLSRIIFFSRRDFSATLVFLQQMLFLIV